MITIKLEGVALDKAEFIDRFAQKLIAGDARVFVGAGVSSSAGYPTWNELAKTFAEEIRYDLSPDSDLTAVVQYYENVHQRGRLANVIRDKLDRQPPPDVPKVLSELAKLPLREVWTTNFDTLVERAWHQQEREIEAVYVNKQLTAHRQGPRTILYKMHGTIEHADDVVISRDDFESYEQKRKGFTSVLLGQYIEKTFLFIGLSFSDPNLAHLFSEIRRTFGNQPPEQYTILKQPSKQDFPESDVALENALREYGHWKKDLEKYGMRVVEVSDYDEIQEIIVAINSKIPERHTPAASFGNSRVLVIDDPDSSISDHLASLSVLTGGIEHRICSSLHAADKRLSDFEPNVVLINPRFLGVDDALLWIESVRSSESSVLRRIVFGVIRDPKWTIETDQKISDNDFGSRVANHYSLKILPSTSAMLDEVARFISAASIDFALQYLDEAVTSIIEGKNRRLSVEQVDKFSRKALTSVGRLDDYESGVS